ncbi:MAG: Gfo/Idh/MocA family oxidoreductase [Victivallaceae bacterium]|nr:Gfo/Idh/MocA family oxidoreductase [Victivallaceae bacterium]
MSNKIKIGIIGLGRAGFSMHRTELEFYTNEFEIVAACDIDPERCENFAKEAPCRTYTDINEFLADPEMELVSVATRSGDHVPHTKLALEAGKFVFMEKPVAVCEQDLVDLKELDEKYPGKIFLRQNRRFESAFMHIREIIASGILGEVYEIKLRRNNYQRRDDWQTIIDCNGGQLNNWGPHLIDHALRFLESPCADVWSRLKKIAAVGDAEDFLKIVFTGENGRIIDVEINGGAALPEPVYVVSGDRGMLISDDESKLKMKYLDPEQQLNEIAANPGTPPIAGGFGNAEELKWIEKEIDVAPSNGETTRFIWKHLYLAIRYGVPFPITMEEGLGNAAVTLQVKQQSEFAR